MPSTPPTDAAERMRQLDSLARTATKATRKVEVLEAKAEESSTLIERMTDRVDQTDAKLEQIMEMMKLMIKQTPDYSPLDTTDDKPTDNKIDCKTTENTPDGKTSDPMMPIHIDPPSMSDMPLTHTSLLNEIENANPLKTTDPDQYVNTSIRHTTDNGTLFRYYKEHDTEDAFVVFEKEMLLSGEALRTAGAKFQSSLRHFDNPKLITKALVGIRLLSSSESLAWRQTAAEVIQSYVQTPYEEVQRFADHCKNKGTPPGSKRIATIAETPGAERLSILTNPEYAAHCLQNLFEIILLCISRIVSDAGTQAEADILFDSLTPERSYVDTWSKFTLHGLR